MVGVRRDTMLIECKELDLISVFSRSSLRLSVMMGTYNRDIVLQYIRQNNLGNELRIPRLCKVILELPGAAELSML